MRHTDGEKNFKITITDIERERESTQANKQM